MLIVYYTLEQELTLIKAPEMESSALNPDEYSSRVQALIQSMSTDWGSGLEYYEIFEHEESRCRLDYVCKVAGDNRRRCLA